MGNIAMVTIVIIAITSIISYKGFQDLSFFEKFKFNIRGIQNKEHIRYLSSGFLHVDISHLFVNMLTLYFFANVVIRDISVLGFLVVYVGSLLIGNLFAYFFHKDEPQYSAVGASGAVMGILYSAILLRPDMTLGLFFVIPIPAYIFGVGYLLYTIYGMKSRTDNIGHDAHFGGAMGGYLLTILLQPRVLTESLMMVFLLLIPIVVLFFLKKFDKI
ncbi:rhomboid family intramembrane serine protease [Mesonia sp. K7]|uniref:rhomboid family intramembrane serine protease n=1 Tax=Mesonia sp. K7 TaxID=2218606 RepID=UPI000DA8860E|nr:rhomboid family intramembrane serine protease [Mesonia sp. K7]PZD79255.1 rhomboid family intramembrane serine protease [Mesonia sp. K7]